MLVYVLQSNGKQLPVQLLPQESHMNGTNLLPPPPLPSQSEQQPAVLSQTPATHSHEGEDDILMDSPSPGEDDDVVMESTSLPLLPAQAIVGAGTHNVQMMKASFFRKKDDLNETYSIQSPRLHPPLAHSSRPGSRLDGHALLRPSSVSISAHPSPALSRSVLHQSSLTSSAQPSPISHLSTRDQGPPPLSEPMDPFSHFHPRHSRPIPFPQRTTSASQAQSAVLMAKRDLRVLLPVKDKRERNLCDHGLFLGRSFRVGWGPNWTLVHSGVQVSPSSSASKPTTVADGGGGWSRGLFSGPVVRQSEEKGHPIRVVLEQVSINSSPNICDSVSSYASVY